MPKKHAEFRLALAASQPNPRRYVETDYLLSSPKNAARLGKAVKDLKTGRGRRHKLIR
jgi:hypothetical protein